MLMGSRRLIFDSSSSSSLSCQGNMLFLGNGNHVFGGGGGGRSVLSMEESGGGATGKRRPFFSTPEELMMMEDDYYDEQMLPEKKRRLTADQVHMLERSFEAENKLEPERKSELARKLGLQPRQVAVWFQNRRARWKTKQLERDFDHLKSSYDSLLADHDSLLKDNLSLRSQMVSLTEKLQAKDSSPQGTTAGGGGELIMKQPEPVVISNTDNIAGQVGSKAHEDHLSTAGSGGSAVVDQESPQLADSGEDSHSHFPEDSGSYNRGCVVWPVNGCGIQSEEDDGSSDVDGRAYFSAEFAAAAANIGNNHQYPEEEEEEMGNVLGWSVWWS